MRVAVLMTCHDRVVTTVECLKQLFAAAARLEGMSYSQLMGGLHKAGIEINRKVLADLALNNPDAFKAIVAKVK